ncbi:MAG: HD domain-containing protein [Deltaproteobacteria bacterium]|nr:HD domain-containing protein [Deltaproteobacteria bacterium]
MTSEEKQSHTTREDHIWVKDIQEDDQVRGLYAAKTKRLARTKRGDPFLSITLSDRTGDMECRVWDNAEALSSLFKEGDILDIEGRANSYRNQVQLIIADLKVADNGADPSLFLEATSYDAKDMIRSLREVLKTIKEPHLKKLMESFLSDRAFMTLFKEAPAAKNFHHGYVGGLLEHTLSVCRLTDSVCEHYPQLDRDLLLAGAFLHDIGKIKEFKTHTLIEYTDEGRLLGHLVLGAAMLDEKLDHIKSFPRDTALRLKHLILSHHGEYDFGSPKRPKFLEAFVLHFIDDLDAKVSGLGRFMERDTQEGVWTDFNRMFDRYLLKGKILEVEEETFPSSDVDDRQELLFKP